MSWLKASGSGSRYIDTEDEMAVIVSGPVLASVLYGQADCPGDQEGLLIGQVSHSVTDTISDSQINNYKKETKIHIYSCNILSREKTLTRKEQLVQCMTEHIQKHGPESIMGWYRSRRNSSMRASMMERSIHNCLLQMLPQEMRDNFYLLLATGSQIANGSTHNIDFGFHKLSKVNGNFQKVPVTVVNLGDTMHNQYKHHSSFLVSSTSGIYSSVINGYQGELVDQSGKVIEARKISGLSESLQSKLTGLTQSVVDSECQVQSLKAEIEKRRQILDEKLRTEQLANQSPPSPQPAEDMTPALLPESPQSSKSVQEAIAKAKQKREQKRREAKSLFPRQHSLAKNKGESPLTRRLSAENDDNRSSESTTADEDLSFIDDIVSEEGGENQIFDHHRNDNNAREENCIPVVSCASVKPKTLNNKDVLKKPSLDVKKMVGDKWNPPPFSKTVPQMSSSSGRKSKDDHFSFVSGLIAQEKVKSPQKETNSLDSNVNSMTVTVGGTMKLSTEKIPTAGNISKNKPGDITAMTLSKNSAHHGDQLLQGERSRSQVTTNNSASIKEFRNVGKTRSSKSKTDSSHMEGASYNASKDLQTFDLDSEEEDMDVKNVGSEHGQLESFQVPSSPVF